MTGIQQIKQIVLNNKINIKYLCAIVSIGKSIIFFDKSLKNMKSFCY